MRTPYKLRQYDPDTCSPLFENLMRYSGFESTEEINTIQDLRRWFDNVDADAEKRGRNPIFKFMFKDEKTGKKRYVEKGKFRNAAQRALVDMKGKGLVFRKRNPEEIKTFPKRFGLPSRWFSSHTIDQAEEYLYYDTGTQRYKYKSAHQTKGKTVRVWRDKATGRFAKSPE